MSINAAIDVAKKELLPLLIGMLTSTVTLEISLDVYQKNKTRNRIII